MKNFEGNKLSRGEMKNVLGGLFAMNCYCLTIHGEPTTAGYGCVTLDSCLAGASSICSSGQATCFAVVDPV